MLPVKIELPRAAAAGGAGGALAASCFAGAGDPVGGSLQALHEGRPEPYLALAPLLREPDARRRSLDGVRTAAALLGHCNTLVGDEAQERRHAALVFLEAMTRPPNELDAAAPRGDAFALFGMPRRRARKRALVGTSGRNFGPDSGIRREPRVVVARARRVSTRRGRVAAAPPRLPRGYSTRRGRVRGRVVAAPPRLPRGYVSVQARGGDDDAGDKRDAQAKRLEPRAHASLLAHAANARRRCAANGVARRAIVAAQDELAASRAERRSFACFDERTAPAL